MAEAKKRKVVSDDGGSDGEESSGKERFTFFWGNASPFSQWHPAPFKLDDVEYNCAEQYMMHQKAVLFNDQEMADNIMATSDPRQQKAFGRKVSNFVDQVWKDNCRDIVKRGNMAKFTQNLELQEALLATADTTIVEASPRDTVWGIGLSASSKKAQQRETWRGTNWLGEIITAVRDEITEKKQFTSKSNTNTANTSTTTTTTVTTTDTTTNTTTTTS